MYVSAIYQHDLVYLIVSTEWRNTIEANETYQKLERIQEKLNRLQTWDSQGSLRDRLRPYHMNPPLSAERIAALEEHYQISLPEEYRLFLQEIGNGSTEHYFGGLFPLEHSLEIQWDEKPLSEMYNYFREPFVPPLSKNEVGKYDDGWDSGLLTLEHTGCGECSYLVVSGTEYGYIWQGQYTLPTPAYTRSALCTTYRDEWFDYLLSPANKERLTFLSWYEYHLDNLIRVVASENR